MNLFNRILLGIIAIALAGVGALGLTELLGPMDTNTVASARDRILDVDWADPFARAVVLGGSICLVVVALALLIREVTPRPHDERFVVVGASERGRTRLSAPALTRVIEVSAEGVEGAQRVTVSRLDLSADRVGLEVQVLVPAGFSVKAVGANVYRRVLQDVEDIFPEVPRTVEVIIELAHGRRSRKKTRRVI